MKTFDWGALAWGLIFAALLYKPYGWAALLWGALLAGVLYIEHRQKAKLSAAPPPPPKAPTPARETITLDLDTLMPGDVWKCSTKQMDLAVLAYEDLETLAARAGMKISKRGDRKAVWEPRT